MLDNQFAFRVNGRPVVVSCDPSTPLGLVLRNHLGLRGTRLGCEQGDCGACTVVIEGRSVQSCNFAVDMVRDAEVVTIEALVSSEPPHPLVEAILDEDAGQCGFCLAGIVMSAYPLFGRMSDRDALRAELARNLCRCGAHTRILSALDKALKKGAA